MKIILPGVFSIHVFYRILKLFVVFVFRLPSGAILARGIFSYLSNFYPWNHPRTAPKLLIFSDLTSQMLTSSLKLWFFEPQFFSFGTLNEGFLKPKSGLLKRNPYFLDLWYGFKKTVKKLNIHHYDDFLKWKFDHVDHGRSNTVVVWFWYLPDFFVLSTGFTLNNFFFVKPVRGFKIFFLGKYWNHLLKFDGFMGKNLAENDYMNSFIPLMGG